MGQTIPPTRTVSALMSKKTEKKKMKARTSKANHGTKPNAGKRGS